MMNKCTLLNDTTIYFSVPDSLVCDACSAEIICGITPVTKIS